MNQFKKSFILCLSLLFMCGAFLTAAEASGVYPRDIPVVTDEPDNVTVVENTPASFTITATGTEPLAYVWQKNGADISGATATTYNIPAVAYTDNGSTYRCIVSNAEGADTSVSATLTVTLLPPVITVEPTNQTAVEGSTATFSVVATGTVVNYKWQKVGTDISGATTAAYTTPAVAYTDNGSTYRCIAYNDGGSDTSVGATLTVTLKPPVITAQPASQSVAVGGVATFKVTATGTALHYKWQRDSVDISGAPDTAVYITPATTMADSGAKFRCVVSNSGGSVTSNQATLTVRTPPLITVEPNDTIANEGTRITFRAKVSGSLPITYLWYRNDTVIASAVRDTYQTRQLTIIDSGSRYKYVASNSAGKDTSRNAIVNVNQVAPVITQQPVNDTVYEGATAQFRVRASYSRLTYQWQKNGVNLTDTNAVKATYTTPPTALADSGAYTCIVTNPAGSVTSNPAMLVVYAVPTPPQIVGEPVDVSVQVGDTAMFKVSATGTALSFQWQRKNSDTGTITNVAGALDSVYKRRVLAETENGRMYRCIVSNPGGKDTSVFAKLNVSPTGIILSNLKKAGTVFQIGPNPSSDLIYFKYLRSDQQKGTLVLYDAVGNKVYERECFLNPGARSFLTIDLKNTLGRKLGPGTYLAVLKVKNGKGVTETFVQQLGVKIKK